MIGTKLDTGVYLDQLKRIAPEEQVAKVEHDLVAPPVETPAKPDTPKKETAAARRKREWKEEAFRDRLEEGPAVVVWIGDDGDILPRSPVANFLAGYDEFLTWEQMRDIEAAGFKIIVEDSKGERFEGEPKEFKDPVKAKESFMGMPHLLFHVDDGYWAEPNAEADQPEQGEAA